ncbi:MAG TPA: chorismate mutase [Clostridia bacterium]|nr:chorismate mutase [Clostridia bacterium]
MKELAKYRKQIDVIDAQLVDLFERRMELSIQIAIYKITHGESVRSSKREKEVLQRAHTALQNLELDRELREFFITIMELSSDVQTKVFALNGLDSNGEKI